MELFLELIFFLAIGYYIYQFAQVLFRLGHHVLFPISEEDLRGIRKHPDKPIYRPTFSGQRTGVIIYSCMLLFIVAMFFLLYFFREEDSMSWFFNVMLLLPLTYSDDGVNLFAIVDDGILSGNRFIAWDKIKDVQFIPIDMNHRFYGFNKGANSGYELKVKAKFRSTSCVVMSDEMKEKLTDIITGKINVPVKVEKEVTAK
ncbi:hypothetical protein [Oceanobacillus sp. Castelsardo]|uniref:hypothetical protein n=1 Tax=Oceanobacillus sp. Castelsardo TaxID=1851204 RepID=UPI00083995B4|nr:hypothetical protein [Oceanobacillus sp. Castelsardo]